MNQSEKSLNQEILEKKVQKGVYIIAHYYQRDEIQDIADFVGDSYAMALAARNSPSDTILVAGVDFMAQTAAILCPGKTILSPEPAATCPMANSIDVQDIQEFKDKYPDGLVVSYVNTPAEVKAVSDICCTSSNAEKILRQLPTDKRIFFIPDQNLARNVARKLNRDIDIYPSQCPIHAQVNREAILRLKLENPQAQVLVHPECDPEVVGIADYIGSTAGILNYVAGSTNQIFIIGTEQGIFHAIDKVSPGKQLLLASPELICPNMKSITLEKILHSINQGQTVVTVPEDIAERAILALERMIELAS